MKQITIFLASSISEFSKERVALRAFCADLGDILDDYDYDVKLFACEDYDKAIQSTRTQEKYNEFIKMPCDIFFNLYGTKAGKYTIEEMDVALDTYHQNQKPLIHIGFVSNIDKYDDETLHSIYKLAIDSPIVHLFNYEHHTKDSINQLKLALLNAISQAYPLLEVEIKGKEVFVFGQRVLLLS